MLQNPQLNHPDERETRKPALADHFNVGCCQVIRTCTRANKPGIAVWDMCKRMVQHEASCRCQVYTVTVAADGGSGCAEATGVTMSCAPGDGDCPALVTTPTTPTTPAPAATTSAGVVTVVTSAVAYGAAVVAVLL
eukprot:COSAG03_NODE_1014_length_5029_cov_12.389363_3_plen_136_part_00